MGMHDESARRVSDCVTALLTEQPFFGSLALRLPIRPDPTRETLASDGRELRYSPAWVVRTDADRIKAAVARVVFACALKHHTRRGERDPGRWQRASQLVTHGELRRAGFVLPADAEAWEDLSVEDAYERLAGEASGSGDEGTPGDGNDDAGGASGSGSDAGGSDGSGNSGDPGDASGSGDEGTPGDDAPDSGDGSDDSGGASGSGSDAGGSGGADGSGDSDGSGGSGDPGDSGQDAPAGEGEPPSHDPAGTGEVMDAPARGAGEDDGAASGDASLDVAAEEQAWDEAMHQAVSLAKAQGSRPGRIEETLHDAHRSRLDWRTLLRQYLVSAARDDYRWSVPNRRFIDAGLYLPSMHCEGIDTLAVLIDTSDSLDTDTLATFWTELRAVAEALRPHTLAVVQVDTEVQEATVYRFGDLPEELVAKGRGGTDFRPGFAWLDREGITPRCCLYLTDMECDRYPESPPPYPVLWCNWGPVPPEPLREPWGERIDLAP